MERAMAETTAAATATNFVEEVFREEGDSGTTRDEMLAGNVATTEWGGGGGHEVGETDGKKGLLLLPPAASAAVVVVEELELEDGRLGCWFWGWEWSDDDVGGAAGGREERGMKGSWRILR